MMPRPVKPYDPVSSLIANKWVLPIRRDGGYVAFRSFGWTGPDPHEQITAKTRDALQAKLRYHAHHTRNRDT